MGEFEQFAACWSDGFAIGFAFYYIAQVSFMFLRFLERNID
jgi:hypothetical protein